MLFEKTFDLGLILNGLQIVSPPYGICAVLHKKYADSRHPFLFFPCVRMHIPSSAGMLKYSCFPGKESDSPATAKTQGGYHMNRIHKLFEQLKEGYREYVRITTCDYRF